MVGSTDKKGREDGRQTREKLLRCAIELTAQKGFSAVTSKEICQRAGTNLAAVNYHFGSRNGLYEAMLYAVHNHMVNETMLKDLAASNLSLREKLEHFADNLLRGIQNREWTDMDGIALRVWLREGLSGSERFLPAVQHIAATKGPWLLKLFRDYTGLPRDDKRLYAALITFVAPFLALLFSTSLPQSYRAALHETALNPSVISAIRQQAFAGLDSLKE